MPFFYILYDYYFVCLYLIIYLFIYSIIFTHFNTHYYYFILNFVLDDLHNQVQVLHEEKAILEEQYAQLTALTANRDSQLSHAIERSLSERTAVLQDRMVESDRVSFAFEKKASDLSKVLRASQIRSEELLEENIRYSFIYVFTHSLFCIFFLYVIF